jgi:hypothetical protein
LSILLCYSDSYSYSYSYFYPYFILSGRAWLGADCLGDDPLMPAPPPLGRATWMWPIRVAGRIAN